MTYTDLQASIAEFLNRQDLTAAIPTFVRLAEAQIARDVRHWRMEKRKVAPFDEAFEELPEDWLETIRLQMDGQPMELASREEIARARQSDAGGRPRFFCHSEGSLEVWPAPNGVFEAELLYFARVPALTAEAPTNWLLTEAPDVYLYGALIHTAPYLVEDERAQTWGSLYAAAVQNLNQSSNRARHSGPLRLRVRNG